METPKRKSSKQFFKKANNFESKLLKFEERFNLNIAELFNLKKKLRRKQAKE